MNRSIFRLCSLLKWMAVLAVFAGAPAWADDISNGSWTTLDGGNTAAPPNGWPPNMFPNAVEPSARAGMGGVKRWWERANAALNTTGSAGAYVITPSNTSYPTAYTQGEIYCAKANFTSVGSDTLNVNSLGAKPLYNSLVAVGAGAIQIGQQFCASYDGSLNSGAGGFQILGGVPSARPISSVIAAGSAISCPASVTDGNVTSISLGAGEWNVWGNFWGNFTSAAPTRLIGSINTTSAAIASGEYRTDLSLPFTTGPSALTVPMRHLSLSVTTTVYLVVEFTYGGTCQVGGGITAQKTG